MAGLHIRMMRDEKMIVNGAAMHFLSDAEFRFTNRVRFVYGRQLMAPYDATNTARRLYLAIQTAYVGDASESAQALSSARMLVELYREATTSSVARTLLDTIRRATADADFYTAMRCARRLVRHEDAIIGRMPELSPEP